MIVATARNSGKTELAVKIIKTFSKDYKISGWKVSTYYDGDLDFHGKHSDPLKSAFSISKNSYSSSEKNTKRMLDAGASEVFWMRAKSENISDAIEELFVQTNKNNLIVCESNSLRNIVKPGIFIMINNKNDEVKETASSVLPLADIIFEFDENKVEFDEKFAMIDVDCGKWKVKTKFCKKD